MSAQAQSGSPAAREKGKTGLGKMLSRMKTVLRKDRHQRSTAAGAPGPSTAQTSSAAVPIQLVTRYDGTPIMSSLEVSFAEGVTMY